MARYEFEVTPGVYRVSATWNPHPNRATNTPFEVFDGVHSLGVSNVNQRQAPDDLNDDNAWWEDLGLGPFVVEGNRLAVEINNLANGYVIADGIRLERLSDTRVVDNTDGDFRVVQGPSGSNERPTDFRGSKAFAAAGSGGTVFEFNFPVAPGVYRVAATWAAGGNRATNAPFTILDGSSPIHTEIVNQKQSPQDTTALGTTWEWLTDPIEITSNHLRVQLSNNANGYVIADAIRLVHIPDVQTINNGDPGFTTTGTWQQNQFPTDYLGDKHYATSNSGPATATWTFDVAPGTYEIYVAWTASSNRTTAAHYTIYDGATPITTRTLNQRQAPNTIKQDGVWWQRIELPVSLTENQLRVELTNLGAGILIADAVRLVRSD